MVLDDASLAEPLAAALARGGLRTAEITFRTAAAAESIRIMAADPEMLVGAGTVLTRDQVDQAVKAGARFIVSPGFGRTVVRHCQQLGVPVFPGVATATEIQNALEVGVTTVKFFPAEQLGGAAMVKALAAPFRDVRFIPTGGVTAESAAEYVRAGAVAVGLGSWLTGSGEPALVAERARQVVAALAEVERPA